MFGKSTERVRQFRARQTAQQKQTQREKNATNNKKRRAGNSISIIFQQPLITEF
jgi:hypothetical protein